MTYDYLARVRLNVWIIRSEGLLRLIYETGNLYNMLEEHKYNRSFMLLILGT